MPQQRPTAVPVPLLRLDEAVRELPAAAAALEAALVTAGLAGGPEPLARRLQLRDLQQAYVLHTLLAKKARVSDSCCVALSSPLGRALPSAAAELPLTRR